MTKVQDERHLSVVPDTTPPMPDLDFEALTQSLNTVLAGQADVMTVEQVVEAFATTSRAAYEAGFEAGQAVA